MYFLISYLTLSQSIHVGMSIAEKDGVDNSSMGIRHEVIVTI